MPLRLRWAQPVAAGRLLVLLAGVAAIGCIDSQASPQAAREKPRADCYGCHALDYQRAHRHLGEKPTRCAVCHLESGWHPTQLDHPWPLGGAHRKADCLACHTGTPPEFERTDKACVACHRDDYDRSEYPGHDKLALTCADCHSDSAWKPARKSAESSTSERAKPENQDEHGEEAQQQPDAARQSPPTAAAEPDVDTNTMPAPAKSKTLPAPHASGQAPVAKSTPESAPNTPEQTSVDKTAPSAPSANAEPPAEPRTTKHKHPESAFPITTGNHTDIECETCHNQPGNMGKANTDCVQCHKRSKLDRKHARVADYPAGAAPPSFCVDCHAHGTVRPITRAR